MNNTDTFNPFSNYDYVEQDILKFKVYGVIIDDDDKILSITEDGSLLAQVALDLENNKLSLIGKDGALFSTVDLPLVDAIEDAYYNEETQSLIIVVKLNDGTTKEIVVPFGDLLANYAKIEALTAETLRAETVEANKIDWTYIDGTRKAILLVNNSMLLGEDKSKASYNLAMVNEWDIADFGSSELHTNLNSINRPTVQLKGVSGADAEGIAYISDIDKLNTEILDIILAEENSRELADEKLQANIDAEETRAISIEGVLRTDVDKLRVDVDYESSRALEAEANINNTLDTKVTWDASNTKIVIPSGGAIIGTEFGLDPLKGGTIASLNEWGVMDFGSPKYKLNLNVPDGVRPTVQEKSQSGIDANEIAYTSDTNTLNNKIDSIEIVKDSEYVYVLNIDGNLVSTIKMPDGGIIKDARYDDASKQIILEFFMADSTIKTITINVADLIDTYVAGDGLILTTNKFSIQLDPLSQPYISVNTSGLKIEGIDEKFITTSNLIIDESIRAKAAEKVNADAIIAETVRAEGIETTLRNDVDIKIDDVELIQDTTNPLHYVLIVDGLKKGDINIPKDQFLKSANYDTVTKELVFIFTVETGETTTRIDVTDFVETYTAGNGLIEVANKFSVKLNPISESYLTVGTDGIKLSGILSEFNAIKARLATLENMKFVTSSDVTTIVQKTQAEYDAMTIKEPKTLYVIIG